MARRKKEQSFHDWLEEEQRDAILEQDRTLAAARVRDIAAPPGGTPNDAEYVVTALHGDLSAEVLHSGLTGADLHAPKAHTVASHSDTTATGAELETLTDGSDADSLHDHTQFASAAEAIAAVEGEATLDLTGDVGMVASKTVDGRDVSADGTKLDGVAAAQFLVLALSDDLSAERRLVAGSGFITSDGGANNDYVLGVDIGIANNKVLKVNHDPGAADDDYAKFTTLGIEGRSYSEVRTDINVADGADVTGSNTPQAHKDSHDPNDGSDALDTANAASIAGVQAAGTGTAHSLARSDHVHGIAHSIADNALVTVDGTTNAPANADYAKFTASGLEGKTAAELMADLPAATKTAPGKVELATTAEIDTGSDSTRAMPVDQFVASDRNIRFVTFRLIEADTACAVDTTVGGDWVCPFTGTLLQSDTYKNWCSANNDTAGTTGTMVVDVHKGGTTVMTTNKLDIETGEKSTNTATTQPDLTVTAVTAGDVFTFDIDAIHTTAAEGLSVTLAIRMT